MKRAPAHYPGRPQIDAYGNGGFRFAEMSHIGSLLFLPSGVYDWDVTDPALLCGNDLEPVLAETGRIQILLLGTGKTQIFPSAELRQTFATANIGLDVMDSGAAARTYNVLLAEQRDVAAALIAVD